jgi:4-amino-4-deoxy-L-arabinose transferase-like glycosyltransferase
MNLPLSAPETAAGGRPYSGRSDSLANAVAVILASLFFFSWFYRLPLSETDEGIVAVGAERILRGQVPYRDFFSELGPASFYMQAAIFKILGTHAAALRLTAWLLGGIISGLIYLLARRVVTGAAAFLPSAVFALVCYPAAYRVSHHWWGNFFLLLTVLCLMPSETQAGPSSAPRRKVLVGAGVLAGLTLLSMQSMGAWALLMGAGFLSVHLLLERQGGWRDAFRRGTRQAGWFVLGAALTLGCAAAYFASQGALAEWVNDNFLFLLVNYRAYLDVPQASPLVIILHIGRLAITQPSVHFALYAIGYPAFVLGPALAYGGTAWQLLSSRRPQGWEARILLLLLLQGVGALLANSHALDTFHLMSAAPLMLVLLVYHWRRIIQRRTWLRRAALASAALALALAVFAGVRKAINTAPIGVPVPTRRGIVYRKAVAAQELRERVAAIERLLPAGTETFFYPYNAELYFLTATRNPTRYDVLLPEFHTPQQMEEALATLRHSRPEFIFSMDEVQRWTIRPHFPDDPPDVVGSHPVESALRAPGSGYRLAETVAGMEVWTRKP